MLGLAKKVDAAGATACARGKGRSNGNVCRVNPILLRSNGESMASLGADRRA